MVHCAGDEMTDQELNKALALKIGYLPERIDIRNYGDGDQIHVYDPYRFGWRKFDYMEWKTIMPIGVRYGVVIGLSKRGAYRHYAFTPGELSILDDTPQRAIALAVLGMKE